MAPPAWLRLISVAVFAVAAAGNARAEDAWATTFVPGGGRPCYRCLFPEPPPPGSVPACAEAGILGALTGVLGSMMALEVIREIVGFGEGLVGRLVMLDARAMRFETLQYAWDPSNPLTGERPTITDLAVHGELP